MVRLEPFACNIWKDGIGRMGPQLAEQLMGGLPSVGIASQLETPLEFAPGVIDLRAEVEERMLHAIVDGHGVPMPAPIVDQDTVGDQLPYVGMTQAIVDGFWAVRPVDVSGGVSGGMVWTDTDDGRPRLQREQVQDALRDRFQFHGIIFRIGNAKVPNLPNQG